MGIEQDILGAIDAIFSLEQVSEQDKGTLAVIHREVKKLTPEQKKALSDHLLYSALPNDNLIPMWFFLYDCFEDIAFLEKLVPCMPETVSVAWFYEFYCNVSHRLFRRSGGSELLQTAMRQCFYRLAEQSKRFLSSRGLLNKQINFSAPKNIAIVVPQLMHLRHSPTREAFNIALHLMHQHGCNVQIINTNAMNYTNCNQLKLLMPANYEVNETLQGQQQIPVKYMQFDSKVSVVSFDAGPMSSQKVANIASALQQLEVEAVVAHGENLLVMECLYQIYPSLFATTGAVVPFNHCDGYFIPGNLFNDTAKNLAALYGHENFMLESMLVTPEGQAEQAAAKSQFGIDDEAFLYLVVGTRLTGELDSEFIAICQTLLAQQPQARVLFAGTPELQLEQWFDEQTITAKRVLNLGFQQDLAAISAMCDVYLNPKRAGGGTSSQTAILNNLPVVTLDHGHISAVVPETKRQKDWQDYLEYAGRLATDAEFLAAEQQLFTAHFYEHLDSGKQIERMYHKLCEVSEQFE
ncbi:glycosyltransferase [Planctobacterium marinum]|uniref:Glycosyltransferase n=1 Tax=Planctobacterium marinum TaxID=1631968 RepID=A0AA48KT05_9ALTE|nr:hypothetical protein MACH26_04160 [Planctobacterium marinum]